MSELIKLVKRYPEVKGPEVIMASEEALPRLFERGYGYEQEPSIGEIYGYEEQAELNNQSAIDEEFGTWEEPEPIFSTVNIEVEQSKSYPTESEAVKLLEQRLLEKGIKQRTAKQATKIITQRIEGKQERLSIFGINKNNLRLIEGELSDLIDW